jgi:transcriptional regulator with XRE-family HTH domain
LTNIRTLRLEAGLTQARLAALLKVDKNTVARWERDEMQPPPYVEAAIKYVLKKRE